MPSKGLKFVNEFLIPNLNTKRFGSRLMWLNQKHSIFQVQWCHKSATDWSSDDAEVFMAWDKMKGRLMLDDKERFTKSKQRFRAIIYKLIKANHITELSYSDKCTKIYCLGNKKAKENIPQEAISKALNSIEVREKSTERTYNCRPETVVDVSELPVENFMSDNKSKSIFEEHQYANIPEMEITESEVMVPNNQIENCDPSAIQIQHVYIDIITCESLYDTFKKYEDNSEDFDDYDLNHTSDMSSNAKQEENSENDQYKSPMDENSFSPESFLSNYDKNEKSVAIEENQLLPFSVWEK